MTLLELIQRTARSISLPVPSVVISNTDTTILELLEAANQIGQDLVTNYVWQRCVQHHVFETTAAISRTGDVATTGVITNLAQTSDLVVGMIVDGIGLQTWSEIVTIDSSSQVTLNLSATAGTTVTLSFQTQDYALPSGYDRMQHDTQWDRSNFWPNSGPKSSQAWATLKNGIISTGPRLRYQILNDRILFTPPPTTKITQAYSYISNFWVVAAAGTKATKNSFTADGDVSIFFDNVMIQGTKFFWLESKGLDTGPTAAILDSLISKRQAQDSPASIKSLSSVVSPVLISPNNIPETGYGQ